MKNASKQLIRVPEVAIRLGLKEATVRRMILERRLPTVRVGRTVSVPKEHIEQIIIQGYREVLEKKEQ